MKSLYYEKNLYTKILSKTLLLVAQVILLIKDFRVEPHLLEEFQVGKGAKVENLPFFGFSAQASTLGG